MLLNFGASIRPPQGNVKLTLKGFDLQISLISDYVMHLSRKVITVHISVIIEPRIQKNCCKVQRLQKKKSVLKVPKSAAAPFRN